jgi:hypothetical protein
MARIANIAVVTFFLLACGGKAIVDGKRGAGGAGGAAASTTSGMGGTSEMFVAASSTSGGTCMGDPKAAANYPTCTKAKDPMSCIAAGGNWTTVGLSPNKECLCPTGQGACACNHASQCLSGCIVENVPPNGMCPSQGHCAPFSIVVGCVCLFDENGKADPICID